MMAKIKESFDVGKIKAIEEFMRFVSSLLKSIGPQINGGLEFGDNIKATIVDVVIPSSSSEVIVPHKLNKIPTGYIVVKKNANSVIYDGSSAWTESAIYLRASAAVTAKVMVI